MKKIKTGKPKTEPKSKVGSQAEFEDKLEELFYRFRAVDDALLPEHMRNIIRFLVARLESLEIRMDANKNHGRGHVHIKYKKDGHAASYAINNGARLAGDLPTFYDRIVQSWIIQHQRDLQALWDSTQKGKLDGAILLKFQTTVYD